MPEQDGPAERGPRVAILLPALKGGGAERVALEIARASRGCRCVLLVENEGGELVEDPLARDAVVLSGRRTRSRHRRIRALRRALRELEPDLLVTMLSPLVATGAAAPLRIPVIQWLQNPWSLVLPHDGRRPRAVLNRIALKRAAGRSAALVGATPGLVDEVRDLGVPPEKLACLPNAVPLPPLAPPTVDRAKGRVASIGRLAPQKRHDLLLAAFARVAESMDLHLDIYGTGPQEAELRALTGKLRIQDRVRFRGFVPRPAEHLSSHDVFVLCSDFEGFGNVYVEALARGVRIVATDVPYGARFIFGDEPAATLVPAGNAEAIGTAIVAAIQSGPLRAQESARARRRAQLFSASHVAARFDDLVLAVLNGDPLPTRGLNGQAWA